MVDIVSIGSVFIDDIVYPDGRTQMGVLGGGPIHAACGMVIWDERPGLCVTIGADTVDAILPRLSTHCDTEGIVVVDLPQIRAWQVFEHDGTRHEILRVKEIEPYMTGPAPEQLPAAWGEDPTLYMVLAGGDFLRWHMTYPHTDIIWEPNQYYITETREHDMLDLLPMVDVISPNLSEARAMFGPLSPDAIVHKMLSAGARVVVLRMGADGSLVATRGTPRPIYVPAVPVAHIVDVTGAGNVYNGAFTVAWRRTGDALIAARWGAVAASFSLESEGLVNLDRPDLIAERDRRLAWLESQ
ncbi:MAG: hypothetical protein IT298_08545 [Chloroflexi bacterium]|jgi:sugar/nucleoside kinase (ribokinase family)|nr:MAG: ribokinase-like domain-containing protein [Chloroflexi bacterium OLB13]MBC6957082.1 hypothetical protein [Chloroflexota bacterium]MBV6436387.1 hypothetical protein [Anaerolineae bacterium]MDL1916700.1 hypothetical protein [Anaerolineae bacterium CFX4]OQY79826.1 MAG: hypothetical protein B6D42_14265 [Anaerolineae bacterium UTCFX5]